MDATSLTAEQLDELREQARRAASRFLDPHAFYKLTAASFHDEWAAAVLGRPYPGLNRLDNWEIDLLAAALDAEPVRPVPAAVRQRRQAAQHEAQEAQRRAAGQHAAELATWHALRARLPVPVFVAHNWTLIHTGTYRVGRDHIVAMEAFTIGRLTRPALAALCEIPSMSRRGNRDPLRGLAHADDGEDRVPTCRMCLNIARKIARSPAPAEGDPSWKDR